MQLPQTHHRVSSRCGQQANTEILYDSQYLLHACLQAEQKSHFHWEPDLSYIAHENAFSLSLRHSKTYMTRNPEGGRRIEGGEAFLSHFDKGANLFDQALLGKQN